MSRLIGGKKTINIMLAVISSFAYRNSIGDFTAYITLLLCGTLAFNRLWENCVDIQYIDKRNAAPPMMRAALASGDPP